MIAHHANLEHIGFTADSTGILDFYHAGQYLWERAAAWLDGRTTQVRRGCGWVRHRLRHGKPDGVLADLAEALEVEGLPDTAQDTLITVYVYLARHREHIDYEAYKELGLPLGGRTVESAANGSSSNVSRRLVCAGVKEGLKHLLYLRLAGINGSFEAFDKRISEF